MLQHTTDEARKSPEVINIKRNPYLVDYEKRRGTEGGEIRQGMLRTNRSTSQRRSVDVPVYGNTMYDSGRNPRRPNQGTRPDGGRRAETGRSYERGSYGRGRTGAASGGAMDRRRYSQMPRERAMIYGRDASGAGRFEAEAPVRRRRVPASAREGQRKKARYQKLAVGIWVVCVFSLTILFLIKNDRASAAGSGNGQADKNIKSTYEPSTPAREETPSYSGAMIQGLPAEEFARHPDWTENFLTPNEYSRPGDPLEEIKNVFVHYTGNRNTSAAQNRSYFEQQKDTHERSVSSHFIIGYEGEIIQCVPLDEIAYAVATRNGDSVSIECCYTAENGSFTQATYDSLIALLAWLTDVYDLEKDDILRHYDCGGKKCPIYYTEHEDAWERLKQDVMDKRQL